MEVQSVALANFRNYEKAKAEFSPGLNLIVGRNGQGKTNLLESIHLLSALGSHRAVGVGPLIRHGEQRAVIRCTALSRGRTVQVDAEAAHHEGIRLLVNKVPLERSKDVGSILATILFSPDDLALTKGGPEERRRFIDQAASRVRPLASAERQQFERVLKQRNGLLKAASFNPRALNSLEIWDEQLSQAGAAVVLARLRLLESIEPAAAKRYAQIAPSGGSPRFEYRPSWVEELGLINQTDVEDALAESLRANRTRDLERGVTTSGPHRDDLVIFLDESEARIFGSQGEQRSLALALRLAERDVVAASRDEDPVLLLDDVFSELDEERRVELAALVAAAGQTIATATSASGVPMSATTMLRVESGEISRE